VAQLSTLGALGVHVKHIFKWLTAIMVSALLFAVIWICWVLHRTEDCQLAYLRVQRGDSPARVIELCGQPARVSTGLETNLWWEDSKQVYQTNGACVQEFHYYPPFSICGESWEVGFDDRSNVVSKYHFISP
jgi:hypothetical protein